MVGDDLEGDGADGHSQNTPSSVPSNVAHFSSTFSQAEKNSSCSLQQKTDPFPVNRTNFSNKSRNLESLTKGATSVLAARKANFSLNVRLLQTASLETTTSDANVNSDEALTEELLCDFNDFSDDITDDIQTSSVTREPDPHSNAISQMDTCSAESAFGTTAPKESSFFSKLCEGTNYISLGFYVISCMTMCVRGASPLKFSDCHALLPHHLYIYPSS